MLPQRREFGRGGNHFSFTNPTSQKTEKPDNLDGTERTTGTNRFAGDHDHIDRSGNLKFGIWPRRVAGKYDDSSNSDGTEFKWVPKEEEDDLDSSSPPLWKNACSPVHESSSSHPILHDHSNNQANHIYPTSRSEAITKYRKEMIEMVRDLPESAYELSLRDLVELPKKAKAGQGTPERVSGISEEAPVKVNKDQKKMRKGQGKKQMLRSESMESGVFLLKMFFPISFGWKRRNSGVPSTGSKVSPKPIVSDGDKGRTDKSVYGDEMSRSSSGDSSTTSGRRKMSGCYSFLLRTIANKGKARGH